VKRTALLAASPGRAWLSAPGHILGQSVDSAVDRLWANGEITLFVRPHDLGLIARPDGAALIQHIKVTGAFAKIEVTLGETPITAMLPFHRLNGSA
jgi:hypothetical protein